MLIWILIPLSHPVLLLLSLLLFLLILLYFDRPEKSSDVIIASFFINIFKNIYFTYLAAPGLSCGFFDLPFSVQDLFFFFFSCIMWDLVQSAEAVTGAD